eukprot:2273098-Pyramimonas_sp.AAC.1
MILQGPTPEAAAASAACSWEAPASAMRMAGVVCPSSWAVLLFTSSFTCPQLLDCRHEQGDWEGWRSSLPGSPLWMSG